MLSGQLLVRQCAYVRSARAHDTHVLREHQARSSMIGGGNNLAGRLVTAYR